MVKKCPACRGNNQDEAAFCSSCGASFTPTPSPTPIPKPAPIVRAVYPITQSTTPIRVTPPGMCYYHPNLPAAYICSRCGRPICRYDTKPYHDINLCPQCYQMVIPYPSYKPPMASLEPQHPPMHPLPLQYGTPLIYPVPSYRPLYWTSPIMFY